MTERQEPETFAEAWQELKEICLEAIRPMAEPLLELMLPPSNAIVAGALWAKSMYLWHGRGPERFEKWLSTLSPLEVELLDTAGRKITLFIDRFRRQETTYTEAPDPDED